MPNRRQVEGADGTPGTIERRTPLSWVVDDGVWPDGPYFANTPVEVVYAAGIAVNLAAALEGHPRAAVARRADVARSTLYDILGGKTWPDFVSLVKLGEVLGVTLWPEAPPAVPLAAERRT